MDENGRKSRGQERKRKILLGGIERISSGLCGGSSGFHFSSITRRGYEIKEG